MINLTSKPTLVYVDGKFCPDLPCSVEAIIKGDQLVSAISAASIIAKVTRDAEMVEWDRIYPEYGFAKHKGYPTKQHLAALQRFGITPIHRLSFAPVANLIEAV